MKKKRTETTVEVHQILVVRRAEGLLTQICPECPATESVMLSPEEASVLLNVPPRAIYRWVEEGLIHYREMPDGLLLVCAASLQLAVEIPEKELKSAFDAMAERIPRIFIEWFSAGRVRDRRKRDKQ